MRTFELPSLPTGRIWIEAAFKLMQNLAPRKAISCDYNWIKYGIWWLSVLVFNNSQICHGSFLSQYLNLGSYTEKSTTARPRPRSKITGIMQYCLDKIPKSCLQRMAVFNLFFRTRARCLDVSRFFFFLDNITLISEKLAAVFTEKRLPLRKTNPGREKDKQQSLFVKAVEAATSKPANPLSSFYQYISSVCSPFVWTFPKFPKFILSAVPFCFLLRMVRQIHVLFDIRALELYCGNPKLFFCSGLIQSGQCA